MARVQDTMIGIRLNESMKARLMRYAESQGMKNKKGDPNLSEAARVLIYAMLSEGVPDSARDASFFLENARAEWMERVNAAWREAMEHVTRTGLLG